MVFNRYGLTVQGLFQGCGFVVNDRFFLASSDFAFDHELRVWTLAFSEFGVLAFML